MAADMTCKSSPCPVIGCKERRKHGRLLCLSHWRRVSRSVQSAVWSTWDAFQHATGPDRQAALLRYREAANQAIEEASSKC